MEILLLAALLGLIPAVIAARKGRNFLVWYFYGAALFIVALPHAILARDPRLTRCPHCAEAMRIEARICPYCRLPRHEPAVVARSTKPVVSHSPRPITEWKPPTAA